MLTYKKVQTKLQNFAVKKDMSSYLKHGSDRVLDYIEDNGFERVWVELSPGHRWQITIFLNKDKNVAVELGYSGFGADTAIIYTNINSDFIKLRDELRTQDLFRTPTKIYKADAEDLEELAEELPVGSTVRHATTGKKHKVLGHTRAGNVMITAKNYAAGKRSCKAYLLIPA